MFRPFSVVNMTNVDSETSLRREDFDTEEENEPQGYREHNLFEIPSDISLIDISRDKKVIAYLLKHEDGPWVIYVFSERSNPYTCHVPHAIVERLSYQDHYYSFLSVSSDGTYIALSFSVTTHFGIPKTKIDVDYVVFKRSIVQKQGYFNGRALFLTDDRLALVSTEKIEILNTSFQFDSLLDTVKVSTMPNKLASYYMWWEETSEASVVHSHAKKIIAISRFISSGLLVATDINHLTTVWLILDGSLLTSFRTKEKEDVMAISKYRQQIATYHKPTSTIYIYHVKSGLRVNSFEPRRDGPLELLLLEFSQDEQILVMVGREDECMVYTCWNIVMKKMLFFHKSEPSPYIEERMAILPYLNLISSQNEKEEYEVTYINKLSNTDNHYRPFYSHKFKFNINRVDTENGWIQLSKDPLGAGLGGLAEITNSLDDSKGVICYTRQEEDSVLVLRFGLHTVQLWRKTTDSENMKDHELLFIRAHKPRCDDTQNMFNDNLRLVESHEIRFMTDGRIQITLENLSQIQIQDELFLPIHRDGEDYCSLESVCRALHYLSVFPIKIYGDHRQQYKILYKKTHQLLEKEIEYLTDKSQYFCTLSGSNTMAILASFEDGQDLLYDLFAIKQIPFSIFSFKQEVQLENVLTVLIDEDNDTLAHFLYNKIIVNSKLLGPGVFLGLVDTLLYLQYKGNIELLLKFTKNLSNLCAIGPGYPSFNTQKTHDIMNISNQPDSNIEKLYTYNWFSVLWYKLRLQDRKKKWIIKITSMFYKGRDEYRPKIAGSLCIIPLPHFNTYYQSDTKLAEGSIEGSYRYKSRFVENASCEYRNQIFKQGDTIIEKMLNYKWKKFGYRTFMLAMMIYIVFYVSFIAAVSFPQHIYGYVPGEIIDHPVHVVATLLMFLSCGVIVIQELRQFLIFGKREYFGSFYNWIDIATYSLTLTSYLQLRYDHELRLQVGSITILMMWIHGMLRLRIFPGFGVTLEIIIQLIKKILPVLLIMMLVVFAFTHSYIYLLQDKADEFFQDFFAVDPDGLNLEAHSSSASNPFGNAFRAFSVLWFLLFGVWDPLIEGDVGDDTMTIILSILFSFITVVIFLNIVIAIMSNTVEQMTEKGNSIWLSHFAAVLAETEMLWCTESQRHDRNNNPNFIYYFGSNKEISKQADLLKSESLQLLAELEESKSRKEEESRMKKMRGHRL
ncbi:hypothetical protein BDB01DRAFT_347644 [Pilobolus umbonatus]|nr:hypothetical protein BDB01DRAFT_347644 [Pilobolus umbonatus]